MGGYGVWIIYTEDLTYDDLETLFSEQVEEIRNLVSGKEYDEETVPEISEIVKKKPDSPAGSGSESARQKLSAPALNQNAQSPPAPPPPDFAVGEPEVQPRP
jgi:hypothetical protein